MQRAARERPSTLVTWRRHLARHGQAVTCACEFQPGRFRKGERIGGCGKARCFLCHADKLRKVPKLRERRAAERWREGVAETGLMRT